MSGKANEPAGTRSHVAWGLTIRTALPLPELPSATFAGEPDVDILAAEVPAELTGATDRGVRFQVSQDRFLLQVDGVARYLVERGRRIVVDRNREANDDDVRVFLLGTVFGALLDQRRDLVLHGSAVEVDGAAAIFLGASGHGKSTMAALLRTRGRAVLTDEICAIRSAEGGRILVQPGVPQLQLWPDSIEQLGARPDDFPPLRRVIAKRAVPLGASFHGSSLPVRWIFILSNWNRGELRLERITGPEVVDRLRAHAWHFQTAAERRPDAAQFQQFLRLAQQARTVVITRPEEGFQLEALAVEVEKELRA